MTCINEANFLLKHITNAKNIIEIYIFNKEKPTHGSPPLDSHFLKKSELLEYFIISDITIYSIFH